MSISEIKLFFFLFFFFLALCLPILRAAGSHRSSQVSLTEAPYGFDCIFWVNFYKCCLCSRRKRGEKGEVVETIEDVIVRRLTTERIEELKKLLRDTQEQYRYVHAVLKTQTNQNDIFASEIFTFFPFCFWQKIEERRWSHTDWSHGLTTEGPVDRDHTVIYFVFFFFYTNWH